MKATNKIECGDEFQLTDYVDDYHEAICRFMGVSQKYTGIFDEIEAIRKFISITGERVLQEESEFDSLFKKEYEIEEDNAASIIEKYIHKKIYRQLSYGALLLLIHSKFEEGLKKIVAIVEKFNKNKQNRIPKDSEQIGYIELSIKHFLIPLLPDSTEDLLKSSEERKCFKTIRNKINHSSGIIVAKKNAPIVISLEEFGNKRTNFSFKKLEEGEIMEKEVYQMEILNSSLLVEYLELLNEVFKTIEYKIANL